MPNHTFTQISDVIFCLAIRSVLIESERAIIISKNTPDCESTHLNTLHFFGNIIGAKVNFINWAWEFDDWLGR